MQQKIPKETRSYLIRELKDYKDNLKYLEELRMDIIEESPKIDLGTPSSPNKGNEGQTAKVYRLITNMQIKRLSEMCKHINNVLSILDDIKYEFYIRCFEKKQSKVTICLEMPISEETYYRYKKYIVNALAEELGFI